MRALLLSAGFGTRLRPVTYHTPKCLVPIHGKPLIDFWFEQLFEAGIERCLVNTHYLSEQVMEHVSRSRFAERIDVVHENELLNTGGTLIANSSYFGKKEPIMVAHADNLSICDFGQFLDAHHNRPKGIEITMMTFETESPESCGIVEINEQDIVVSLHEKVKFPPSNLANGAVYIMDPSVIGMMKRLRKEKVDIVLDVLPEYLNRIKTYRNDVYHRDIGNLESYGLAQIEYCHLL